ncbi:MAG TPA: DUF6537 domain-containing protein, partial [Solirubrobacterales bacterium]|nr:DUF6537 domain-containing protein [Solirubrobacterales bacterium]
APIAAVRHRDELAGVEAELATTDGVTVLIYDDRCATEERRLRKRGQLPAPSKRVWINERVCEGCGDCGEKSTCLSVQPVETELGRKTRIHQASCNQDYSCLDGDCPSFLVVEPGRREAPDRPAPPAELPAPPAPPAGEVLVRMPGIGGTGVVTVSQILQMAAHLDGIEATGLEQIGLAQKGGPVTSDVRFAADGIRGGLRASRGRADAIIGFDLLGAASEANLEVADPARTVAIVNTGETPTAQMVTDVAATAAEAEQMRRRIDAATRSEDNIYLDAEGISLGLFGDHMPANMLLIGVAFQAGCLPLSAAAIERAIELNGAAVEVNIEAFRWGRAAVALPAELARVAPSPLPAPEPDQALAALLAEREMPAALRGLLARRGTDLVGYQSRRYACEYVEDVLGVATAIEAAIGAGAEPLALAYARNLHKLMAYKDEYEVARLHLDELEAARLRAELGEGAKVKVMLHPPLLRAMGMKRKLAFGRTARPLLGLLRRGKFLRGRALDPFGRAHVRRIERELIGEYRELVATALAELTPECAHLFAELIDLPDRIRGYEGIKLASVERFRVNAQRLNDLIVKAPGEEVSVGEQQGSERTGNRV